MRKCGSTRVREYESTRIHRRPRAKRLKPPQQQRKAPQTARTSRNPTRPALAPSARRGPVRAGRKSRPWSRDRSPWRRILGPGIIATTEACRSATRYPGHRARLAPPDIRIRRPETENRNRRVDLREAIRNRRRAKLVFGWDSEARRRWEKDESGRNIGPFQMSLVSDVYKISRKACAGTPRSRDSAGPRAHTKRHRQAKVDWGPDT